MKTITSDGRVLLLRTCHADSTAHGGFQWPLEVGATVEAPDWDPSPRCGGGLHGLPWGLGDATLLNWSPEAVGIVFSAAAQEVVDIDGAKAKVRAARVEFVGPLKAAAEWLYSQQDDRTRVGVCGTASAGAGGTASAGYRGHAIVGAGGTASAGYDGTAIAGDRGTASALGEGTAIAGDRGTASAGTDGRASAGTDGRASAGYCGHAIAGTDGHASAGDRGTASAGAGGTASAGCRGHASAGIGGRASAGDGGTISIERWDGLRYRRLAAAVGGEGGLKPGVTYRLDDAGAFVEVPADPQ